MKRHSIVLRCLLLGLLTGWLAFSPLLEATAVPTQDGQVFFPLVLNYLYNLAACVPDPPGESDNVGDARVICDRQTVTGRVDDLDKDDVYQIYAVPGERLVITMWGNGGDADLYLYPPGTHDVHTGIYHASSVSNTNNELIDYTVTEAGYWYIDISEYYGSTYYSVTTAKN